MVCAKSSSSSRAGLGGDLTLAGLQRTARTRAGPSLRSNGPGWAMIFRPMQGSVTFVLLGGIAESNSEA